MNANYYESACTTSFCFGSYFVAHEFQLDDSVHNMLPRVPIPLQEAISRLTCKEPASRPTAQLLQLIKYFRWVCCVVLRAFHPNWQCVMMNVKINENKLVRSFQWSRCACDAIFRCDKYEGSNTEGTFLSEYFAWSSTVHSPGKLYASYSQEKASNALKFLF